MITFEEKFNRVYQKIKDEGIEAGFDNIMGLTALDGMVDVITQTPRLREHLHQVIREIITNAMLFEMEDEGEEFMKGYT